MHFQAFRPRTTSQIKKSQALSEGQSTNDLQVALTRGGRIVGQMLDEDGRPPKQGLLTLLRQGERLDGGAVVEGAGTVGPAS
jgi:hypothetical protein